MASPVISPSILATIGSVTECSIARPRRPPTPPPAAGSAAASSSAATLGIGEIDALGRLRWFREGRQT